MARSLGFDAAQSRMMAGEAVAAFDRSGKAIAGTDMGEGSHLPIRILTTSGPDLSWFFRAKHRSPILRGAAYEVAKRFVDVLAVVAAVPVAVPALLVCWLAVKLEEPDAPALFVQERTGRMGLRFRMFKLRTMVPDAEEKKAALAARNKLCWPDFKIEDDPRITPLGRWLRKTSLDELPQLLNVLKGDMSLVGPRPTSFGAETYQEWQKARLAVPPGLTGLWQIAGRAKMEFDERVRLDLAYVARRSLSLDLRILLRTVGSVVRAKGAC